MLKFRRLKATTLVLIALVVSNVVSNFPPANAGEEATGQAIVDLIRHANIVNPTYQLTASISDEEALVTTQRKPKATDADCKILSTLIAKTAFDALPDNIQRVKIILLDFEADASSSVVVNRAVIKLYGSGALSNKELLASLALTTTGAGSAATTSSATTVAPGPQEVDRMLLLGRIEKLKSKGTNVSAFMNFFNQIEAAAKAGNEQDVASKVTYLRDHITEQEQLVKQAHAVSTNRGQNGFDAIARQYSAGTIDPKVMNIATRQVTFQNMIFMADPHTYNAEQVKAQLKQVTLLMEQNRPAEADKLMTKLEATFGH